MTIKNTSENFQESEFFRKSSGKIFKGTMSDAPTKLRVASIPSKFQNVIYRNHKIPAFGNSRQRFYSNLESSKKYQPGPGNYTDLNKTGEKIFSKRGYGTLISNTKLDRFQMKYTGLPGPGSYDSTSVKVNRMKKSISLALLSSKIQGHELFKKQLQNAKFIPGPGLYNVKLRRSNTQVYAFSKKTERFENSQLNEQTPGVGHYNFKDSSLRKSQNTPSPKIIYKKSTLNLAQTSDQQKLKVVKNILNSTRKQVQGAIGPGSYNTNPLDKKIGFKIHQTSYNRFGQSAMKMEKSPDKTKQTADNQSDVISKSDDPTFQDRKAIRYASITQERTRYKDFKAKKVLTSMFKSNISRYDFIQENINDPGRYSPSKVDKKSHLINFQNKWV